MIEAINGVATLSVPDPALLLRNQTGKQILLKIKDGKTGKSRDAVAVHRAGTALLERVPFLRLRVPALAG